MAHFQRRKLVSQAVPEARGFNPCGGLFGMFVHERHAALGGLPHAGSTQPWFTQDEGLNGSHGSSGPQTVRENTVSTVLSPRPGHAFGGGCTGSPVALPSPLCLPSNSSNLPVLNQGAGEEGLSLILIAPCWPVKHCQSMAISACHIDVEGKTVGQHPLVIS